MLGKDNPWVIGTKWDGFWSQKLGRPVTDNPHNDELLNRLWENGHLDAAQGQSSVSGNFESYWFIDKGDDAEQYEIYHGSAFQGMGRLVGLAATLDLARELVPRGERLYHIADTEVPGQYKLDWFLRGRKPRSVLAAV